MNQHQLKYYPFKVRGGQEEKIKTAIQETFVQQGLQEYLGDILIPSQPYKVIVKEKIINKQRRISYIIIGLNVDLATNEKIKQVINNVKGVKGPLGHLGFGFNQEPVPINPEEITYMQGKEAQASTLRSSLNKKFEVGEVVQIVGSPIANMPDTTATVKRILKDGKMLIVTIRMFRQDTEVQLSALQVEKIT